MKKLDKNIEEIISFITRNMGNDFPKYKDEIKKDSCYGENYTMDKWEYNGKYSKNRKGK